MRSTTLPMETFGKQAVEQYAETTGTSVSAVVRAAARYYLADRDSEKHAWRVPRFVREGGRRPPGEELTVDVDDATWAAIEQEALRQGVTAALLTQHAVLYYLADLGRASSD